MNVHSHDTGYGHAGRNGDEGADRTGGDAAVRGERRPRHQHQGHRRGRRHCAGGAVQALPRQGRAGPGPVRRALGGVRPAARRGAPGRRRLRGAARRHGPAALPGLRRRPHAVRLPVPGPARPVEAPAGRGRQPDRWPAPLYRRCHGGRRDPVGRCRAGDRDHRRHRPPDRDVQTLWPHPGRDGRSLRRTGHRLPPRGRRLKEGKPMSTLSLLRTRRFLPLFLTQLSGAFNDNLMKNAFVVMAVFSLAPEAGVQVAAVAGTLLILPFFLFAGLAGEISDRFEKSAVARPVKFAETPAMAIAAAGFLSASHTLLFAAVFLMGSQAAFFGPVKYALLPEHLRRDELVAGNALFESTTFLVILLGTMAGGFAVALPSGPLLVAAAVIGIAALGFAASLAIPATGVRDGSVQIRANILASTWALVRDARTNRT